MTINRVGIQTEILDGNLVAQTTIPGNTNLIIERAFSGPSDTLYIVDDFKVAESLYGTQSPLIQLARDAIAGSGGTSGLALYRIGGGGAEVKNIFGEYSLLGTVAETLSAGQDLSVYIGPRPTDASKQCVIVWKSGKIVYSNVPSAIVNTNIIFLQGFDADNTPYRVGSLTAPVAFSEIVTNLLDAIVQVTTATASQTSFTLATPVPTATSHFVVSKTSSGLTTLVPTTAYTETVVGGNLTGIVLTTGATVGDVYTFNYTKPTSTIDITDAEITYQAGKNSLNSSLEDLYELYDTAFEDLENIRASTATIKDLFNCRNIAAGDDAASDRLTYVLRTETEEGFDYEWSEDKYIYQLAGSSTLTTTNQLLAETDSNGTPVIVKLYNECDFAHRLASWCWNNSTSAEFICGTVGAVPPKSSNTVAVKRWIGKLPTLDTNGSITIDGSGLLGNRFMVGTTNRSAGLYATSTGYPDGSPLRDTYGVLVDIGKHLSIATLPCYLTTDITSGKVTSLVGPRSFAAAYAGLITTIKPGHSTTNSVFNQITPLFGLKDSVADKLSSAGYVALVERLKGVTVYSGDLATNEASDFDYISTALAVAHIVKTLEAVIDPYLGRGIDSILGAAMHNGVDNALKQAASLGVINGASFKIVRSGANSLSIVLKISPKEELRVVQVSIALTPDTTLVATQ